ncbi:sulfate transport system substrate-binding protein [Novimethylophilus kurashikiensis]|uniref:Sulfate-binding protein n=1 Tax=Novimethylophilus kurashikiensis TaxID=1825523 RepID=A0A2R5FFE1_9PROT|nr:sulfate ABC transporter substrate-binding protein [Novimethylophilus kurashikiensis]GBG15998.1 sulfate transport system substrate-binding protein [Novimethylophilus kurashikiensis]
MLKKKILAALLLWPALSFADATLLNVSYDVSREFYKDYNPAFAQYWKLKTGQNININQSHGGSSKQARSVSDGLEADVVTMNQASDIDILSERGKLIPADWAKRLPNNSAPNASVTVFLVRKGNPKVIKDWGDLIKPGVSVIIPNPKTSGNGRYGYLAAYGSVLKKGGDDKKAREYVSQLFKHVPVLDTGGRGATTTFVQRGIGDVLLTFENEVALIKKELGGDQFEVIYPSSSVLAENPVVLVDKFADKHKTRAVAQAYLEYLYSEEGQEIAARHHLRPQLDRVAQRHAADFPQLTLFTVDELFGGWKQVQKVHFNDGSVFDQIYAKN